jgi:hypothetical protein
MSLDMHERVRQRDLKFDLCAAQRGRLGQCRDLAEGAREVRHGFRQR